MDNKTVNTINLGKVAEAIWPHFLPILEKKKLDALQRLKDHFRSNITDPSLYIAQVAVITAFDDIINEVERHIRHGREKEGELANDRTE